jgi:GT2 family glycosyltransferase
MGSAGYNALMELDQTDFTILMNPDIMFAPDALIELARPFADPSVAMSVLQLPFEHPGNATLLQGNPWRPGPAP